MYSALVAMLECRSVVQSVLRSQLNNLLLIVGVNLASLFTVVDSIVCCHCFVVLPNLSYFFFNIVGNSFA